MDFKNIDEGYPDGEKPLHFHYNREERIKKAPKIVQDYYAGKIFNDKPGIKGLFKSLVSTKTNKFLLFSLVFFMAVIYIFSFLQKNQNYVVFETPCELEAFSYDERILVSLKFLQKTEKTQNQEETEKIQKEFKIIFSAYNSEGAKCYESEEFYKRYDGNETFLRAEFTDYDIIKVEAEIYYNGSADKISCRISKRN